jgi:hypothetical protein
MWARLLSVKESCLFKGVRDIDRGNDDRMSLSYNVLVLFLRCSLEQFRRGLPVDQLERRSLR